MKTPNWAEVGDEATALLSRYLQIDTTNPPGNELVAAEFLAAELERRGLNPVVTPSAPGRGNVIARLPRTVPSDAVPSPAMASDELSGATLAEAMPSEATLSEAQPSEAILLLHHMDVVTADPARWSCDPFGGEIRDGYVWGRGALDMKGMGVMQLLALDLLLRDGRQRTRDVVFVAVADEEVASIPGVLWLLEHHPEALEGGIVWDEGGFGLLDVFGPSPVFTVAVAEKQALWLRLVAEGEPGHGGAPHSANANDLLVAALSRIHRRHERQKLHPVVAALFGAVAELKPFPMSWVMRHLGNPFVMALARKTLTAAPAVGAMLQNTLSVTGLHAGSKPNVIPERAEAVLDVRLLPGEAVDGFIDSLERTIADRRVRVEVIQRPSPNAISDYDSLFYRTLAEVTGRLVPGSVTAPVLTPGATDSAHFRPRGYQTYGLFPAVITPDELARFHGIDERISVDNLRLGTQIIYEVLRTMCDGA